MRGAAAGKTLAEIALELHRTDFETAALFFDLYARDLVAVATVPEDAADGDPVAAIARLLEAAERHIRERRYEEALRDYERVLQLDRLNQHAEKGLIALIEARNSERIAKSIPLDKVPVLKVDLVQLTREALDPQEGFVISRINGAWDVRSILKLCPMGEEKALLIVAGLIERQLVELRDP